MTSSRPQHPAWRDYRRRRLVAILVFLGYLPAMFAVAKVAGQDALGVAGPVWMVAWAAAIVFLGLFRCPRCRRAFHLRRMYGNPLAGRCLHCGLARWADPGPAPR